MAEGGGRSLRGFEGPRPNSEVRDHASFGGLKLTLRPSACDWACVPMAGETFDDGGTAACH